MSLEKKDGPGKGFSEVRGSQPNCVWAHGVQPSDFGLYRTPEVPVAVNLCHSIYGV